MKHYYIEQNGRLVSDFNTEREAKEYVKKFGGDILVEGREEGGTDA